MERYLLQLKELGWSIESLRDARRRMESYLTTPTMGTTSTEPLVASTPLPVANTERPIANTQTVANTWVSTVTEAITEATTAVTEVVTGVTEQIGSIEDVAVAEEIAEVGPTFSEVVTESFSKVMENVTLSATTDREFSMATAFLDLTNTTTYSTTAVPEVGTEAAITSQLSDLDNPTFESQDVPNVMAGFNQLLGSWWQEWFGNGTQAAERGEQWSPAEGVGDQYGRIPNGLGVPGASDWPVRAPTHNLFNVLPLEGGSLMWILAVSLLTTVLGKKKF
jgi:hypothetical protein